MAKNKLSRKRVSSEDYDSDEGFVEDAPKQKKNKTSAPASSNHAAPEKQKDEDGNVYWEITRTRRIQVSEFKGNTMIGIREFYEKDGKMLPGKKGIALPLEQFNTFVQLLPEIESALQAKDISVPRPDYAQSSSAVVTQASSEPNPTAKANHEATSDEDDD